MLAGAPKTVPEAISAGWEGTAISNGRTRTAGYHHNGSRAAVATAEVTEQQHLLRQLQHGLHDLQTRQLQDQQHLGSATSALQVSDLSEAAAWSLTSPMCSAVHEMHYYNGRKQQSHVVTGACVILHGATSMLNPHDTCKNTASLLIALFSPPS